VTRHERKRGSVTRHDCGSVTRHDCGPVTRHDCGPVTRHERGAAARKPPRHAPPRDQQEHQEHHREISKSPPAPPRDQQEHQAPQPRDQQGTPNSASRTAFIEGAAPTLIQYPPAYVCMYYSSPMGAQAGVHRGNTGEDGGGRVTVLGKNVGVGPILPHRGIAEVPDRIPHLARNTAGRSTINFPNRTAGWRPQWGAAPTGSAGWRTAGGISEMRITYAAFFLQRISVVSTLARY
jgi:hypothetical protein